jgi:hypothetical protein
VATDHNRPSILKSNPCTKSIANGGGVTESGLRYRRIEQYVSPLYIAAIYSGLGDNDQAFLWLEKAYEQRENMVLDKTYQDFSPLRSDPGFADRPRRLGIIP